MADFVPHAARNAEAPAIEALGRLIDIARSDTGQAARVANFLLAWWNAERDGGFDLTDLWMVDQSIADDMILVFALAARSRCYPDAFGFNGAIFHQIVTDWRKPKRARRGRAA